MDLQNDTNFDVEHILNNGETEEEHEARIKKGFEEKLKKKKKLRKKDRIYNILLVVFALIFLFSAGYLIRYYYYSRKSASEFRDLKSLIEEEETEAPDDLVEETTTATGEIVYREKNLVFDNVNGQMVQHKFTTLYAQNNDFVGWLSINDTNIDYPVMCTPTDEEKYLHTNFEGDYSFEGTLFCGSGSKIDGSSDNILIYGHNMKDGSMFHDIRYFFDQTYFQNHKYIHFNTLYGNGEYEIIAVFNGQILNKGESGFRYYNFFTAASEEEFNEYVDTVRSKSVISTDTTAEYGDHLLTLSTCASSGSSEGKRYVIVAKRISYVGKEPGLEEAE